MPTARKSKSKKGGSIRETREDQILRRFLVQLADSNGTAKNGVKSIDTVSADWNVDADKLREFRDGAGDALDRSTVTVINKLLGRDDNGMIGVNMDDSLGFADPSTGGWYGAMQSEEANRQARLRTFQLIDQTRPEANTALHCWADLGITGNMGIEDRNSGGFEPVCGDMAKTKIQAMKDLEGLINGRILPDDQKLLAFRGTAKYGDQWGEIGLSDRTGRLELDRLYPRHARTMYVHRTEDGGYDPNYAYKQVLPSRLEPIAKFPEWKIVHFANTEGWGDAYGSSIFAPCLRSYIQIECMEAGMITRRLERAAMRYKHLIDIGLIDAGDEALKQFQTKYRNDHRKTRTVDGSKNMRMQRIAMPPEEDFYIWKRDKDSPADIQALNGDEYIEQIGDVMHFWRKWLSGLGPPSAHLGYEDEGSKTGVNDKHIVFARKVRRMQLKFIAGLNHLYWVGLMLRGIDPRSIRYTIFPPAMGTRDELLRAQIMLARSTTTQYLAAAFATTGKQPSIGWFLRYVMGYDDETISKLELTAVIPKSAGGTPGFKNPPPKNVKDDREEEMAEFALAVPQVIEQVEQLQFAMNERAIELRLPETAERIRRETMPTWHSSFDDVVRSMGIRELRAA